jgi:hypothetical protein
VCERHGAGLPTYVLSLCMYVLAAYRGVLLLLLLAGHHRQALPRCLRAIPASCVHEGKPATSLRCRSMHYSYLGRRPICATCIAAGVQVCHTSLWRRFGPVAR